MEGPSRKRLRTQEYQNSNTYVDSFEEPEEASCGIIESVTVKNFMCHEHLTAKFEPKINLVQGRNGSGKSAILTAVVLALGGSTRTTNRGRSLKELIKYDKHTATVEIVIKNNGKDAYKYDTFGNTIIVERKFSATSGGQYNIKSSSGKIVSSKKEDLKRICDFFNLNVENPLTVLNQDMSRSFLSNTDPKNLYKFFLQATQLQQMLDYYCQLEESITTSDILIKDRQACLPVLEKEVLDLHNRYEFCIKHGDKRKKLGDLRRELAWATIVKFEKASETAEKEHNECLEIVSKFEEKQANLKAQIGEAKKEHKNVEEKFFKVSEEINNIRGNSKLKNAAQLRAKENMKATQREVDKGKRQVQMYDKEVIALKEAIKRDHTTAQQMWEEQHKLHEEKIEETRTQISELTEIMKTEETHLHNIQNTIKVRQESRMQLQFEERNKKRNIQDLEQELKNLQSQQTNAFTVFGQWVQPLLDKIEVAFKQGRFSAKPIGPLGAYIEMLDNQWAHIAEMVIGGRISAFCVNNSQDERVLRSLFSGLHFGNQFPMIVCCRFRKRHDASLISRNEVRSDEYPSLYSLLKISHDVVANLIIDRCQVESVLLIPTADKAGQILKNAHTVPTNCKNAFTLNGDKYFPDPNYKVYSGNGQRRARYLQISVGERAQEVTTDIQRLREDLENNKQECRNLDIEIRNLKRQETEANMKLTKEKSKFKRLREQLMQLQNQEEPPPPNVSQLEEDIKKQEANHAAALETLTVLQQQLEVNEKQYNEAKASWNELNCGLSTLTNSAHDLEKEMKETEEKANKLMHLDDILKQKVKNHEKKKKEFEKRKKEAMDSLEKEMEMANKFLPRRETNRSPEEIERQYKNLEAKLNKEQELRGDPIEIAEHYKNLLAKKKTMELELEANSNLLKKLKDSLGDRQKRCSHFRKTLSIMVKTNFKETLVVRQLSGNISFDFEKEALSIFVEKKITENDDEVQVQGPSRESKQSSAQQQKLAMMSGGERSFATVAFILSLWEVMDSPVRILDEFDVFMDIIARRQSLDMMISAAKPSTQYIYLTPLEVNRNQFSHELNVFKMPDPERKNANELSE